MGFDASSPREVLKLAFQEELIYDGEGWLRALESRNLMAHTYDEKKSQEAVFLIREKYFFLIKNLIVQFEKQTVDREEDSWTSGTLGF